MSYRCAASELNSQYTKRLCLAIFLVLTLLLRAIDSGEEVASETGRSQIAIASGHTFADFNTSVQETKRHLPEEGSKASIWATPESEGGCWATLTNPSFGDLAIALPPQYGVAVPVPLDFLNCVHESYVLYLPHGPPEERTSRGPPTQRHLSRPLDA